MIRSLKRMIGVMNRFGLDISEMSEECDWINALPTVRVLRHLLTVAQECRHERRVPRQLAIWSNTLENA